MPWALSTTKENENDWKCLEARSKRLTKEQGKGNESNTAEALTDDGLDILYKKYLPQVFEEAIKYLHSDGINT